MDERWVKIIYTLYYESSSLTIEELASRLNCTYNTIKSTISQNEDNCVQNGFKLVGTNEISLEIIDKNKLMFFLSYSNENDDRVNEIIVRLLSSNDYVKIEDLADDMFVSRATIDRLIPQIKEIASKYKLEVVSKPKFGIALQGEEINKRLCLGKYKVVNNINDYNSEQQKDVVKEIWRIVSDTLESNDIKISDMNFYNLVQHCIIMFDRISTGNEIKKMPTNNFNEKNIEKETLVGDQICDEFENKFNIRICEAERKYVMMHLLGKRILTTSQAIRVDIFDCVKEIFDEIERIYNIDFHQDTELITALALHIQPLLTRVNFGMVQENPLLFQIKREMGKGYEIALCASEVLNNKYHVDIEESEVAYLALHFVLALERRNRLTPKKKVLIVCSTGKGTARLIQYRIMESFKYRQDDVILTGLMQLDQFNFDNIECILTTIPLENKYPVSVIPVDISMSETNLKEIDQYFNKLSGIELVEKTIKEELILKDCNYKNREQVIKAICSSVKKTCGVDLYEQVTKREMLSSTEVGMQVALPHPYQYEGKELIICAMSLKKPIKWKYGQVQLILLLCYPTDDEGVDNVSKVFTSLLSKPNSVKELTNDLTKDNLLRVLKEL